MGGPARVGRFDSTLALLADPYRFIGKECRRRGTDLFEARILLQPTICMTGRGAAELFYDSRRFKRAGAAPEPVRATLFGKGGVQGLDGAVHRHRKTMFMDLMTPEGTAELVALTEQSWQFSIERWRACEHVVLYEELIPLLGRSAFAWVGIPVPDEDIDWRSRMLASMFAEAGAKDLRQLRSRLARGVAHALHGNREWRERLQQGSAEETECFVHEVRRFYPFFPVVAARTVAQFEWNGYRFPRDRRVLLDLYGTNHDPRYWDAPDEFRPERFGHRAIDPFVMVPQGGAEPRGNHRCPGEWITIELMKQAARFLAARVAYELPPQDFQLDFGQLPALPRDRLVIREVRALDQA
jgi:fatty-acid peroxygenase